MKAELIRIYGFQTAQVHKYNEQFNENPLLSLFHTKSATVPQGRFFYFFPILCRIMKQLKSMSKMSTLLTTPSKTDLIGNYL